MKRLGNRIESKLLAFGLLVLLVSCENFQEPTSIDPPPTVGRVTTVDGSAIPDIGFKESFPEVDFSRSAQGARSSEDLQADLMRSGGRAIIGLKPSDAPPAWSSGVRPAMSRQDAEAGVAALEAAGVEVIRRFHNIPSVVAFIPPGSVEHVREIARVNYILPDIPRDVRNGVGGEHTRGPSSSLNSFLSSQDTSWGVLKVRAPTVWNNHLGSDGAFNRGGDARITVIDTGIDQDHAVSSSGDIGGMGPSEIAWGIANFNDGWDITGHGSHVIGDAAAWDNSTGYVGIAPSAQLTSIRVCNNVCFDSDVLSALDYTVDNGQPRQIVNLSIGVLEHDDFADVLDQNWSAGNLIVAGGGNSTTTSLSGLDYPAPHNRVIAVTGTLENDDFAETHVCPRGNIVKSSRHGPEAELSAPFWSSAMELDLGYNLDCGTSFAAPVVSGVAALVWTKHPSWTNQQVRSRLISTAVDLGTSGRDAFFGYGRVDAARALAFSVSITGPSSAPDGTFCSWGSAIDGGEAAFSYVWKRDGTVIGTNAGVTITVPSEDFSLTLDVQDSHGEQTSDGVVIQVTPNPGFQIQC